MDFSAILGDANTFPDTIEMTIGAEKVTLGQLRDLSTKQQNAVTERMNLLQTERNEVKELAVKAADLLSKAQPLADAGATRQPAQSAAGEDYWDTDPYYEPVKKRLGPLEAQVKQALEGIKAQNATLERAALFIGKRMFRDDYERSKDRLKGDKYKDYRDPDKLAQYAVDHQLVDEFGFPSVSKAVQDITKQDEIDRIREEAKQSGIEEGRRLARMSTMTRPTSAAGSRGGAKPAKGLDPTKNFEDLGDVVGEDAELMEQISQIAGLDPSQLQ
jgi:hypothetical protein